MSKTPLAELKAAIAVDFNEDDAKLQRLLNAAEQHLCRVTERSIKELCEMGYSETELPEDLKEAVIALAGSWYRTPEANSTYQVHNIEQNFDNIVSYYIRLVKNGSNRS